ncbi:MAG: acetyl-CoA carboxylase biotin carboxylase subunit [Bacteroidota bacterium]
MKKVLVANRGEIAVRVMRTCRELGLQTVAVYSEPDRTALHVQLADEAYLVGPAASSASYLVQERILEVARESGADAIHPGYGFLSENAGFAQAVQDAGLTFIGPPPDAIRKMGDKTSARLLMQQAGVPMAPGTTDAIEDPEDAAQIAGEIGYPVLIKASAGGGGKGMRIVHEPADFERAMQMAQSEARSAFGDDRVYVEKFIEEPRHIEFQILADQHGTIVHLFERECSIQRRHQKVIEEAPSSVLTPALRTEMGEAAVTAARSCGYEGAGTVEFLVDKHLRFYFMEMNTRLQVEHPVTEEITGFDLVAEQLRIAQGEPLGYTQDDLSIRGHAVECRVYAEDPANNFLPAPGKLLRHVPPGGFGVRVDAGVEEGGDVQIHYDPMISKLVTWGRTRPEAILRMRRALEEYEIAGVETTIGFCHFVMSHEAFTSGQFTTQFVGRHFTPDVLAPDDAQADLVAAVAAVLASAETAPRAASAEAGENGVAWSPWRQKRGV